MFLLMWGGQNAEFLFVYECTISGSTITKISMFGEMKPK